MEFNTKRLNIRNLRTTDWHYLKEIWRDNSLSEYSQYDVPHSSDDQEIKELVKKFCDSNDFYMVTVIETGEVIGCIDLHDTGSGYDIGYCFHSRFHKKGYAKESCNALIEYCQNNGVQRFTAGTAMKNIPSVKLLLSLGFKKTGSEKVSFYKDEKGNDIFFEGGIFELLK